MTKAQVFYYPNGVPRNHFGLDDGDVLAELERDLTSARFGEIRAGEAPEAAPGTFDLAHLKAIHQYGFQDVYEWAGVTRSEEMSIGGQSFNPVIDAPNLHKGDELNPPFVPSRFVNQTLTQAFDQLREENYLRELSREAFADRAAELFSTINATHAFMEGNGRTQREFMMQLGEQAGHALNFDIVTGYRMGEVSEEGRLGDLEGVRRMFQEITDPARVAVMERAQSELMQRNFNVDNSYVISAIPGDHYTGVKALHNPDILLIREDRHFILVAQSAEVAPHVKEVDFVARPYPGEVVQVQQQEIPVSLRGLDQAAFAQAAAERLVLVVQQGQSAPAQVREAAQQLGQEAGQRMNLSVITEARLGRDMEAAQRGQVQGFERMFQEASTPADVRLLQRAIHSLELKGQDPQQLYLTVTQPGQRYEGQLELKNSRACIVSDEESRHLVTPPSSLKQATQLEQGRVQFTAQQGTKAQMQMEM